jgi:hypothetical protein
MPNDQKTPDADGAHRSHTGSLGAGAEAAAALHSVQSDAAGASPSDAQHGTPGAGAGGDDAVTGRGKDGGQEGGTERSGSEPLMRDREHKPSYGGEGGSPRTSSDTREPINPS